jgi:hypothetical protein
VIARSKSNTPQNSNNYRKRTNVEVEAAENLIMDEDCPKMFQKTNSGTQRRQKKFDKGDQSVSSSRGDVGDVNSNEKTEESLHSGRRKTTTSVIDVYPNIPKNVWCEYNIPSVTIRLKFKDRVKQLTNGTALLCFLRKGYKVYVRRSDKKLYPCIYEDSNGSFMKYGFRYPIESICADAKISHTDRYHPPLSMSNKAANIVVLTQKYKQCPPKIDALLQSLDMFNTTKKEMVFADTNFGEYNGCITIMGSGGSHFVLGNFAPTANSTKDDACIEIGIGQSRGNPINSKLDQMACRNSVQAVFLNESYYNESEASNLETDGIPKISTVRFLGYYEFTESKFLKGDSHDTVNKEFGNPPDSVWQYLTFRLHPHLQIEAKPFVDTFNEIDRLMGCEAIQYKKVIINHDDHSDIIHDVINASHWMTYNHTCTIQDVIAELINTLEINDECEKNVVPEEIMETIDQTTPKRNADFFSDCENECLEEYDHEDGTECDEQDEDDCSIVSKQFTCLGTVCSIDEVVMGCIFNAASCAMRYNKRGLRTFLNKVCAAPLVDQSLGLARRIRPSLSPNRSLDVNLCFLRIAFLQHEALAPSITSCGRCDVTRLHTETFCEMAFQIILLRFTGRVGRYEEYNLYQQTLPPKSGKVIGRLIPFREDLPNFWEYMEKRQQQRKGKSGVATLSGWVSRQHDGVIPHDLRMNIYKFMRFLSDVADKTGDTIRRIRQSSCMERVSVVQLIEEMIRNSLVHASVEKIGNLYWIAHAVVADLEEFIDDPFGDVSSSSVPKGPYSINGHRIINNGLNKIERITFECCLERLVKCVIYDTHSDLLQVMGYKKQTQNTVINVVNGRPFNCSDAEHFLCKAWLNAKVTFGNYRIIQYPKQCNSFTHPSPVLHRLNNKILTNIMEEMEKHYLSVTSKSGISGLRLPEFCKLPGEEVLL